MTENSLFPGYVLLDYHSDFGAHKAILPTRGWNNVSISGTMGSFQAWDLSDVDAEVMIDEIVAKLKPFHHTTSSFDAATVYTLDGVGEPAIPRAGKALAVAGTSASVLQRKAVSQTWVFRDTVWSISKLVLLDTPIGIDFDKLTDISGSAPALALVAAWGAVTNAWASRNGEQPNTFRAIVYDLNDKLRKEYGMT